MAKMKLTPLSKLVDDVWGPVGTPERDAMEARLEEELQAYRIGEAIKEGRLRNHLTQEQLGEKVGMTKAQISKLESGKREPTLRVARRMSRLLGIEPAVMLGL